MKKKNRLPVAFGLFFCTVLVSLCFWAMFDVSGDAFRENSKSASPVPTVPFESMPIWRGHLETALGEYDVMVREVWSSKSQRSFQIVDMRKNGAYDVSITGVKDNSGVWKEIRFSNKEKFSREQIEQGGLELDLAVTKIRSQEYLVKSQQPTDDFLRMGQ